MLKRNVAVLIINVAMFWINIAMLLMNIVMFWRNVAVLIMNVAMLMMSAVILLMNVAMLMMSAAILLMNVVMLVKTTATFRVTTDKVVIKGELIIAPQLSKRSHLYKQFRILTAQISCGRRIACFPAGVRGLALHGANIITFYIAVPTQMQYKIISQGVGARHAVPLRVYLT